ncbi:MAG TPA: alpha-L-rhamnosidase N-terminal domain-containing protein, partial [Vicinamibacteria bacterium]|nr:alpha-L-rhamnosidase N-terminal domain-containing protein [Vicinamibacteria bacterium]
MARKDGPDGSGAAGTGTVDPSHATSNGRARGGKSRRAFLRRLGASVAASVAAPSAAAQTKRSRKKPPARTPARKAAPTAGPAAKPVARMPEPPPVSVARGEWPTPDPGARIDLAPARWLWLPCERTLANTFVLFRREIEVEGEVASARGWVSADSRYRLLVNGRRVQWGPAPCDPRSYEADPVDLARWLVPGRNVIGAEVLFYGHGEGTWPLGKPGFLFALRVEVAGGRVSEVVSDASWRVFLDRAHRPGQFKRWYLRALQEDFDARLRPAGWSEPGFVED